MHDYFGSAERFGDAIFDFVSDFVCVRDAGRASHSDRDLCENDAGCTGARAHASNLLDPRDALHEPPDISRIQTTFVHQNRNRFLEDLVAVPGDDERDEQRQHRVEMPQAKSRQSKRRDGEQRDVHVAMRVGGVGDEERARELSPASSLVDDDEGVDHQREADQARLRGAWGSQASADRRSCAMPSRSSSKHEIERNVTIASAPSVSNFAWPYGWLSSGRARSDRDEHHPDDVVEQVER